MRTDQRPDQITHYFARGAVRVGDISLEADGSGGEWRAAVVITVHDTEGYPVEGITDCFQKIRTITWFYISKETDWRINSSEAALDAYHNAVSDDRW